MNASHLKIASSCLAVVISLTMAACATTPPANPAVQQLRANLNALESDSTLAPRAPVAIKEAEDAVRTVEAVQGFENADLSHLIYVADRKISIARVRAQGKLAEDQMSALADERSRVELSARTQEANAAKRDAEAQRQLAGQALQIADQRQRDANAAIQQADSAKSQADAAMQTNAEYRHQIDELQAKTTDRGLVITLGDILFATGQADLKPIAQSRLDKLAAFLTRYQDRTALIEGHTDSIGGDTYNLGLSQRRADSVRAFLTSRGVDAARINAVGKGKEAPVASNADAAGRQQNRRVEVIVQNSRNS